MAHQPAQPPAASDGPGEPSDLSELQLAHRLSSPSADDVAPLTDVKPPHRAHGPADDVALSTDASGRRAFGPWMTRFILATAASAALFSPLSANIFIPAIPVLATAFNQTTERMNLAVTVYLVMQGLSPMLWGAVADSIGRRPVYIGSLSVYIAACIGLALVPTSSFGGLLALRCVQALGGACVIAIGSGVVGDIAEPHERGSYLAMFSVGALLGPTVGPIFGGVLSQYLGWRAIFWFLVILTAVCLIPLVLFFPETLRSLVGNGSIPPPALNMTVVALFQRRRRRTQHPAANDVEAKLDSSRPVPTTFRERWRAIKPFGSLQMLLHPDVFLLLWATSCTYLSFYCVITSTSTLFKEVYGLTELQIGLTYIGNGTGCLVGSMAIGRVMDHDFVKLKKTLPPDTPLVDFPLERARFRHMPALFIVFLAALLGFGWSVDARAHLAAPVIMTFLIGVCGTAIMGITSTMLIDLQPGRGSAITGSFNFVRCLLGAAGTATIEPMIQRIGVGWAFVVIAGICIAFSWMPVVILRRGPRWRKERHEAAEAKKKATGDALTARAQT